MYPAPTAGPPAADMAVAAGPAAMAPTAIPSARRPKALRETTVGELIVMALISHQFLTSAAISRSASSIFSEACGSNWLVPIQVS